MGGIGVVIALAGPWLLPFFTGAHDAEAVAAVALGQAPAVARRGVPVLRRTQHGRQRVACAARATSRSPPPWCWASRCSCLCRSAHALTFARGQGLGEVPAAVQLRRRGRLGGGAVSMSWFWAATLLCALALGRLAADPVDRYRCAAHVRLTLKTAAACAAPAARRPAAARVRRRSGSSAGRAAGAARLRPLAAGLGSLMAAVDACDRRPAQPRGRACAGARHRPHPGGAGRRDRRIRQNTTRRAPRTQRRRTPALRRPPNTDLLRRLATGACMSAHRTDTAGAARRRNQAETQGRVRAPRSRDLTQRHGFCRCRSRAVRLQPDTSSSAQCHRCARICAPPGRLRRILLEGPPPRSRTRTPLSR